MSNNRESILLDAVEAVHGHGFADVIGDLSVHPYGWTMATVSPVILFNIGEDSIGRALQSKNITEVAVITRDDSSGDRSIFKVGDPVKVGQAFDALEAAHIVAFPDPEDIDTDGDRA